MGSKDSASKKQYHSPQHYIDLQPVDRQGALKKLRQVILQHLPAGFQETIQYGMIGYVVPHALYPAGYHVNPKEPLPFLGLGNQKHYIALYHLSIYADRPLLEWFTKAYAGLNIGKLDMGKACIRFKKMDAIPFELIGELCSKLSVDAYVKIYEARNNGDMEKYGEA